jgi:epoxyqueuosine reductase
VSDSHLKTAIKEKTLELGFDAVGVAAAGQVGSYAARYRQWLENGFHGKMSYMERNLEKRMDPQQLYEGARSVIVVAKNYYPAPTANKNFSPAPPAKEMQAYAKEMQADTEEVQAEGGSQLKVAKYAWGKDYHHVIREQLGQLIRFMEELAPGTSSRAFTDSAPVLERAWAEQAGLGWTGKNACLIIPRKGSFFFLGEVVTTLELAPDHPFGNDLCGSCVRCLQACPTGAITSPGVIDARRCISYLTIELKAPIPQEFKEKCQGWIFGCDICQDVCPHNRNAAPHKEPLFEPLEPVANYTPAQWRNMPKSDFRKKLVKAGSPMARVKYEKLMDTIRFVSPNVQD